MGKTDPRATEKRADQVEIGDVIVAKKGRAVFRVTGISPGMAGPVWTLLDECGVELGHDTSYDSRSALYMVIPGSKP